MAINCAPLYLDVVAEVGSGVATERLSNAFIRAVNRTLDELAHRSNTAAWTPVTSTSSTISMDADYEYVVYAGVIKNLIRMGFRPSDPKLAVLAYQDSLRNWSDAIGNYIANQTNEASTDSNAHIARLGSVTSDS
jgi:hypothetical protein